MIDFSVDGSDPSFVRNLNTCSVSLLSREDSRTREEELRDIRIVYSKIDFVARNLLRCTCSRAVRFVENVFVFNGRATRSPTSSTIDSYLPVNSQE